MTVAMNYQTEKCSTFADVFPLGFGPEVAAPDPAQPLTLYSALMLAAELEAERAGLASLVTFLETELDRNTEKVEFYDAMAHTDELFNTCVAAKVSKMGRTKFLQLLREHKVLMPSGNYKNMPYQKHIDAGRLVVKWVKTMNRQTGDRKYTPMPLFTGKGIIWIKQLIERNA